MSEFISASQTEKKKSSVDTTVFIVLFTAALALLDFFSHPHGGVADLERRKIVTDILGPIARHLGNYGFSSALAISAVFAKNILSSFVESDFAKGVIKQGFLGVTASILTLNALIETFPKNGEMVQDIAMGTAGVTISVLAAEKALQKWKKASLATQKTPL